MNTYGASSTALVNSVNFIIFSYLTLPVMSTTTPRGIATLTGLMGIAPYLLCSVYGASLCSVILHSGGGYTAVNACPCYGA